MLNLCFPFFESVHLSTQMVLCSAVRLFRRARKDATLGEVSFLRMTVFTVKVEYFTSQVFRQLLFVFE